MGWPLKDVEITIGDDGSAVVYGLIDDPVAVEMVKRNVMRGYTLTPIVESAVPAVEHRCPACGSLKWVPVSLDGGWTRRAQCVPCGRVHAPLGPGWRQEFVNGRTFNGQNDSVE